MRCEDLLYRCEFLQSGPLVGGVVGQSLALKLHRIASKISSSRAKTMNLACFVTTVTTLFEFVTTPSGDALGRASAGFAGFLGCCHHCHH